MKPKPLRILHVGNQTIPCVGGIENVIWESAKRQVELGHDVEIMVFDRCPKGGALPALETIEGVRIQRVPQRGGTTFYRIPPSKPLLERAMKADVIHIHGVGAWLDVLALHKKRLRGILVLTTHGGFFHTKARGGLKWLYSQFILPLSWKRLDGVIFVSPNDQDRFSYLPHSNGVVIPDGIEDALLDVKVKKIPETFLYLGRLSMNKRLDRLINVFALHRAHHPNATLTIAGEDWDGSRERLGIIAREKGVESAVQFTGRVGTEERIRLLAESQFFVSASEYEGFGISAIEAMATGCIPCLNPIPSFSQFITDNRGFLADYADEKKAAAVWERMSALPKKEMDTQKKNVRAFAQEFGWKKIVDRHVEWYHSLLSSRIKPAHHSEGV